MSKEINNQATNTLNIVGKLLDCNFRQGVTRDGRKYESANFTVRTTQTYDGQTDCSEIPCSIFAPELTNSGTPHPGWRTIQDLKTWKTVQDVGEIEATKVRMTNASIRENAFVTRSGQLITGWQISTPFMNQAGNVSDIAKFSLDIFIMDMHDEVDREGDTTGRLVVKGGIVQYGGTLDVLEFIVENPEKVDYISRNWNINDTVNAVGRIRVTSKEVTKPATKSSWGEEMTETSTQYVRELIITGGSDDPFEEDFAYDVTDIKKAFNERKARIEQLQMNATQAAKKTETSDKYSWA